MFIFFHEKMNHPYFLNVNCVHLLNHTCSQQERTYQEKAEKQNAVVTGNHDETNWCPNSELIFQQDLCDQSSLLRLLLLEEGYWGTRGERTEKHNIQYAGNVPIVGQGGIKIQ